MNAKFWKVAEWLALTMLVAEPSPLSKRRILIWSFICVVSATAAVCLVVLVAIDWPGWVEFYKVIAANKENPVSGLAFLVAVTALGWIAHEFKKANQWLYGLAELFFALIYTLGTFRNADLLSPISGITVLGAAVYVVQRGFNNMGDATMQRRLGQTVQN